MSDKEVDSKEKIFCPRCNSQDVKVDFSDSLTVAGGLLNNF